MQQSSHVVVVGAGFAGLTAARELARAGLDVTLVNRTNHHLFQALLYQVASAGLSPSDVATPVRTLLRGHPRVQVRLGEMASFDPDRRRLRMADGAELPYDYLILALGVETSFFGRPDWSRYAFGLKSAREAIAIRESVLMGFEQAESESDPARQARLMTTVVVGGGPTGVELAGAFAELRRYVLRWDFRRIRPEQARVVLVEAGPRLLAGYAERLSDKARHYLEGLGVEVRLGERVQELQPNLVLTEQSRIEAQTIVWTAGVCATAETRDLPGDHDGVGRVRPGPDLRLCDRVYCAGDMTSLEQEGRPLPGVAPVAMGQGRHAARNILRELGGQAPLPYRYREREHIATLGRSAAVFQYGRLHLTGAPAWWAWLGLHLWRIADLQNRLVVFTRWSWSYLSWKWGVRLILGRVQESQAPEDPPPYIDTVI